MRSVRLENTGETDVVNPWLLVNGRRNWRRAADIVGEALASYGDPAVMTDAEKARAIWEFLRRNRFHALEDADPLRAGGRAAHRSRVLRRGRRVGLRGFARRPRLA